MEVLVKWAARAASRDAKSRGPRSREAPQPSTILQASRRPGASLDLGPLHLVFLEAALAADLITVFPSLQMPPWLLNFVREGPSFNMDQLWVQGWSWAARQSKHDGVKANAFATVGMLLG